MAAAFSRRWALPLACTVLCYGLAAGVWKHAALSVAQFCVLFVVAKTVTNGTAWLVGGRRSPFERAARRFMGWALVGQILNGLAWILYFIALAGGPVAMVQTITATYTAVAVVLALAFLRERLVAIQLAGIALAVTAAMLMGYGSGGSGAATGIGWFVASVLVVALWGSAVVVFKHAYNQPGADDFRFFLVNGLGMAMTVLPYGLLSAGAEAWDTAALGMGVVVVLLYCVGDLTLFAAVARGPASIVSPISGLYPVPTVAYAALVLHEAITGVQWLAIAMVLVAIVLMVPAADNPVWRLLRRHV